MDRTGGVTLAIDSQLEHVYLVGLAINTICRAAALSEVEASQVELSVVEGVNNAIEHAYADEPGHRVEVRVTVDQDALLFAVCDRGNPMPTDALSACTALDEEALLAEGGRGLLIMRSFMDEVSYERRGSENVWTLVKRLPQER